jgi:uracil-DNA glycosylase
MDKIQEGCPTKNRKLAEEIMNLQGNLLTDILEILKPKLIISLTGHSLDDYLVKNLIVTELKEIDENKILTKEIIDKNEILTKEMLGEFKVINKDNFLSNTKIIRCYHPSYFLSRINTNKGLSEKLKKISYKGTVANYYKEQLIKKLK